MNKNGSKILQQSIFRNIKSLLVIKKPQRLFGSASLHLCRLSLSSHVLLLLPVPCKRQQTAAAWLSQLQLLLSRPWGCGSALPSCFSSCCSSHPTSSWWQHLSGTWEQNQLHKSYLMERTAQTTGRVYVFVLYLVQVKSVGKPVKLYIYIF